VAALGFKPDVASAFPVGFETKPVAMKNTHHAEMDELLAEILTGLKTVALFAKEFRLAKLHSF
jgi:hypothetical protein